MSDQGESDFESELCTPPEIRESANIARGAVVPKKSKDRYVQAYNAFVEWQVANNVKNLFSESVLLAYFQEQSKKYCPSTLWSMYSMLRSIIHLRHKVNIKNYAQLLSFLSNSSKGYKPVKAKIFTDDEIARFLDKATPDSEWLLHKVRVYFALIAD